MECEQKVKDSIETKTLSRVSRSMAFNDPDNNNPSSPISTLEDKKQSEIAKTLQWIIAAQTLEEKRKIIFNELKQPGFLKELSPTNLRKLPEVVQTLVKVGITENCLQDADALCHPFIIEQLWELSPLEHLQFYHVLGQFYLQQDYCEEALPYLTRALELIDIYEGWVSYEHIKQSAEGKELSRWLNQLDWKTEKSLLHDHLTQLEANYFSQQLFALIKNCQPIEELICQPWLKDLAATSQWDTLKRIHKELEPDIKDYFEGTLLNALQTMQESAQKLKSPTEHHESKEILFKKLMELAEQWEIYHQYTYAERCYQLLHNYFREEKEQVEISARMNRLKAYQDQESKSKPPLPVYDPLWQKQRTHLKTARHHLEERFNDPHDTHYHLQHDYTQKIKQLIHEAIAAIVKRLGTPPCIFHVYGIGSICRGLGPYSDIELGIFVQDTSFKPHDYFRTLITLLDFHLKSLGDPWIIQSNKDDKKEWLGLHIDEGCLGKLKSAESLLIDTPEQLAKWAVDGLLKWSNEPDEVSNNEIYAYGLLRPVSLYFYPEEIAKQSNKTDYEAAKKLFTRYCQLLQHQLDPPSLELDDDSANNKINALHQQIAMNYLNKHAKAFHTYGKSIEEKEVWGIDNLKKYYLAPLIYFCFDVGLYFNLREKDGFTLVADIPEIISKLESRDPNTAAWFARLETVYKAINRLRDAMQLLRGHQPDEVRLPTEFNPLQEKTGIDPATISSVWLPELIKDKEKKWLQEIEQDILQNLYNTVEELHKQLQRKSSASQNRSNVVAMSSLLPLRSLRDVKLTSTSYGFFPSAKSEPINTSLSANKAIPEICLLKMKYSFVKKASCECLQRAIKRGQPHWIMPISNSLIAKTDHEILSPGMTELKAILQQCYQNQPKIPLLLDETKTFALDEIFIDLELIEQKDKSKTDKVNSTDQAQKSEIEPEFELESDSDSENSLTNKTRYELQAKIRESRKLITPEQLFLPLAEDDTSAITIHRLYLQGAAGIGKTTLCRHLAYRWADPHNPLWANQFTLVIYFPLRQVVKNYFERDAEYSLKEIILGNWSDMATLQQRTEFRECFIQDHHKQALWEYIQQHRHRILFLLDGLDEVDSNHPAIKGLLNSDICYLVTSRPQAVPSQVQRYVENVGFTQASRNNYIQNFFKLMQQPAWADLVITWIRENTHLTGLIAIAINCQLFCTAMYLQQLKAQEKTETRKQHPEKAVKTPLTFNAQFTLTELYVVLMLQWEKRALLRDPDLKLTPEKLRYYKAKDIHKLCAERLQILAKLSYQALCQAQGVIISGTWLEEIVEETLSQQNKAADPEERLRLAQQVLGLGVLKAQGLSDNLFEDQFDFAHLTFVEYLAAYYIAQDFEVLDDTPQRKLAEEALLQYQYHPKFEVMWWFVSGHLATMQGSGLRIFFTKLINGPKDLTSVKQFIQLLHCYEQAFANVHLKNLHATFMQLAVSFNEQVLRFGSSNLINHLKRFHEIQQRVFELVQQKKEITSNIVQLMNNIYLTKLLLLLQQGFQDKEKKFRFSSRKTLETLCLRLTTEQIVALLPLFQQNLQDKDYIIHINTWEALICPQLTPEQVTGFLPLLQQDLRDKDEEVRFGTWKALKVICPQLTPEQVTAFLPLLQQGLRDTTAWGVSYKVLEVLKELCPRLMPEQVTAFLPLLQQGLRDKDEEVRFNTWKALKVICPQLTPEQVTAFLPLLQQSLRDKDEEVRFNTWEALKVICPQLTPEQVTAFLPLLQQGLRDTTAWRVSGKILEVLKELCPRLMPEQVTAFLPLLQQGLRDTTSWGVSDKVLEVLKELCPRLMPEQVTMFLPLLQQSLQEDFKRDVRNRVWKALQVLWPYLTPEQINGFLPLLLRDLQNRADDVNDDFAPIRGVMEQLCRSEQLTAFLSSVQQDLQNKNKDVLIIAWRKLESVVKQLCTHLTPEQVTMFSTLLAPGLRDGDKDVRESAWRALKKLWSHLMPQQVTAFLSLLQQALRDKNEDIRISAWNNLQDLVKWRRLTPEQVTASLPLFQQGFQEPQSCYYAWTALELLWPQLIPEQVATFFPLFQQGLRELREEGFTFFYHRWGGLGELLQLLTPEQVTTFLPLLQKPNFGNFREYFRNIAWEALWELWSHLTPQQVTALLLLLQHQLQCPKKDHVFLPWELLKKLSPWLTSEQVTAFLSLLQQALQNKDESIRFNAWNALSQLGSRLTRESATLFLSSFPKGPQDLKWPIYGGTWRALGQLWPHLTPEQVAMLLPLLSHGLQDPKWEVRHEAWLALLKLRPHLMSEQIATFFSLLHECLLGQRKWDPDPGEVMRMLNDDTLSGLTSSKWYPNPHEVLRIFINSLSGLTSPNAKKSFINLLIPLCLDKQLKTEISAEFNVIKYNSTTLHLWKNQTKVEFTVTIEQMAQLEEAFKEDTLDLAPLQKALQEDIPSLSQAPMTYFGSTLTRNDKDDLPPSTTILKPGI